MMKQYLTLLRVHQWYKNLLVFSPLLFFPTESFGLRHFLLAFFGFSLVSSITYIVNDWVDREKDRVHPKKKNRPLASGAVSSKQALFTILLLLITEGAIMWSLGLGYAIVVLIYFIFTNLYSFYLKHVPVLDISLISFNFVLRSIAGISSFALLSSFWPFMSCLFGVIFSFTTLKRRADQKLLGANAVAHKPVLKFYTKKIAYALRTVGYLLFILGLYGSMPLGFSAADVSVVLIFVTFSMYLLSRDPNTVISPHRLFLLWYWDVVLISSILLFII